MLFEFKILSPHFAYIHFFFFYVYMKRFIRIFFSSFHLQTTVSRWKIETYNKLHFTQQARKNYDTLVLKNDTISILMHFPVPYRDIFGLAAKLYNPSTLNLDLILWHTQLIVCAVKC